MATAPTAPTAPAAPAFHSDTLTPPRTRWAAIVWGLLFATVAAVSIWLIADDDRRAGISDWALSLTPVTISTLLILTIGVLLLVAGASALLRRAQRRMSGREAQHPLGDVDAG
jgi:apolipoprotein N-acyltransferase